MRRVLRILASVVLTLSASAASAQTTYHLHNEASTTTNLKQLRTAGPDVATAVIQTANLRSTANGEKIIKDFDTQAGVPGIAGTIPSGSTLTFQLWMRKTANVGTMFPRGRVSLNNASGTTLCTATGTTAVTTALTKYTISCNTTAAIAVTATTRLFLRAAVNMTAGSTSTNFMAELDVEGTLNLSADSQVAIPNILPTPTIATLTPSTGAVGAAVTVAGTGFGATQGTSTVRFNGTIATASSWSATGIATTVPAGATTGNVVVRVGGIDSAGRAFTVVPAPNITSLSPASAQVGTLITIAGTNFGSTQGSGQVRFNGTLGTPTSWNATQIRVPVPAGATTGNVVVTASGVNSNGRPFTVLPSPTITNLSPSAGLAGTSVTISGSTFGATKGSSTVRFNGTLAATTSWSATSIVATVPAAATTGNVVVRVGGIDSNGMTFTVPTLTSITVTPSTPTLPLGSWQRFTANGLYSDGVTRPVPNPTWGSTNGGVATIDAAGIARTLTQGSTTIEATAGAITGSTTANVGARSFTAVGSLIEPRSSHSATLLADGRVLVVGGVTVDTALASAEIYDPTTRAFTQTGSLATRRFGHTATLLQDGRVLIVAGSTLILDGFVVPIASAEIYDPATGLFTPTGSLDTPWSGHTATLLPNGNVLIHAGQGTANLQIYDVPTGTFSRLERERHIEAPSVTRLADGRVLVAGGTESGFDAVTAAFIYDSVAGTLTATGNLVKESQAHTGTLLNDGKVLVTGGNARFFNEYLTRSELYDPATQTFATSGPMVIERGGHAAVRLQDGSVLVIGGASDGTISTIVGHAELYDPVSGTFNGAGALLVPRVVHTTTLLNDGTVLVVGGWSETDLLGMSELYGPPLPPPLSLQVVPPSITLHAGGTQQFIALDDLGRERYDAEWSVSDPTLASIGSFSSPTLTALGYGQVTVTASIGGVTGESFVTIAPQSLRVTPTAVTMLVGERREFAVVDDRNRTVSGATWEVSDSTRATLAGASDPTITAVGAGAVTVTATIQGVSTNPAQITILAQASFGAADPVWTVQTPPSLPVKQMLPSAPGGPGHFAISGNGSETVVQALGHDGRQIWQQSIGVSNNNSVSDAYGGIIVTQHNTCDHINPMKIVDYDGATGEWRWEVIGSSTCTVNAPNIAIRPDGSVVVATPGNTSGLPELMILDGLTGWVLAAPPIPQSSFTDFVGNVVFGYSRIGAATVDPEGVTHVLFEKRHLNFPPEVAWAEMWMMSINPDNSYSTRMLTSTTQNHNLFPGRIMPDGSGGVVATWAVSPAEGDDLVNPYFAAHVSASGSVNVYTLPLAPSALPHVASTPIDLSLVLGSGSAAFATYGTDPELGPEVVSFNLHSGSLNWSHRAVPGSAVALLAATFEGGLVVQNSIDGVVQFGPGGSTSTLTPPLAGELGYSWSGEWYGAGLDAVAQFGLAVDIDTSNVWATAKGNPSHSSVAVALCACESQTEAPGGLMAGSFAQPSRRANGSLLDAGLTFVNIVGDRGRDSHNVGRLFEFAASTRTAALADVGDTAVSPRASNVPQFNDALNNHGAITGGVNYFGHAGQGTRAEPGTVSMLFVGETSAANTNLSEENDHLLSTNQLGPAATVTIYACHAGLKPWAKPTAPSVAQVLADRLQRTVYAWRVGMFFSENTTARSSSKTAPNGPTIYMLPEHGGLSVPPCEFRPGQPEPLKCGGR